MRRLLAASAGALLLAGCLLPAPADPRLADELAVWLCGTFSNRAQHRAAPRDFDQVRTVVIPIWPERDDGPWLYVEQAFAEELQIPYRQRVYHLVATPDGAVRTDAFTLPGEPLAWSGAWRQARPLGDVRPTELLPRRGCSVSLQREPDGRFRGATAGTDCESRHAGAAYATVEFVVTPHRLSSWDRGFDEAGRQVWGARTGPYLFDKLSDDPPDRQ